MQVMVLTDTTYWGRGFGVMLFKDALTGKNVLKYYVKNETNILYHKGIQELKDKGFMILAMVCDGRRGLIKSFKDIPHNGLSMERMKKFIDAFLKA